MEDFFKSTADFLGSKGLVFIGDKLLVYRRDTNTQVFPLHIDVPGGGREKRETPYETFSREVYEEFGLTVQPADVVYARKYSSAQQKNRKTYFAVAKLSEDNASRIQFGTEGVEFMLLSVNDYLRREDAWPVFKERTADYIASSGNESPPHR